LFSTAENDTTHGVF